MTNDQLTIALPKGRLGDDALSALNKIGYGNIVDTNSRQLIFEDKLNHIKYLIVKPVDVITYVSQGVADIGIIGKDNILEEEPEIYELLDLGFGKCKFSIAGYPNQVLNNPDEVLRVATKYPTVAHLYFKSKNQKIEIIKLNGSVELAPLVGLSDVIVDIVETGSTLKANGLIVLEDMFEISAKLISNRVSYRFKSNMILPLLAKLSNLEGVLADDKNN
ncbi:MAG: ATP phosphoribosyltransferase [Acholeplasmataceae bacterium]|jgi:ATP phosphoribosyltransferase|nr:ATP phosphoribosyltransferase [Acholeplasmataceae bacterium]